MQKKSMTVGQHYAASVYYGTYPLGSDHLVRVRLVGFQGNQAVLKRLHDQSGRVRKDFPDVLVSLQKVSGTWEDHQAAVAAKQAAKDKRLTDMQVEANKRNAALAVLDQVVPNWDEAYGDFNEGRYEVGPWMSPRVYESGAREQVTLHNDKSGVNGGKGEVTVVFLAALVEAAYEAGKVAVADAAMYDGRA